MAITTTLLPAAFNFSKNFIPVKFQSDSYLIPSTTTIKENYAIVVNLLVDVFASNGVDFTTKTIKTLRLPLRNNANGFIDTDFAELLHSYMEAEGPDFPDFATTTAKRSTKSVLRFSFSFGEVSGAETTPATLTTSSKYIVIYGGLSYTGAFSNTLLSLIKPDDTDATKDRFLRQGNAIQYTRSNQPQFLYFLNTRATKTTTLKAKLYFTNGDILDKDITTVELLSQHKYAFNLTFDKCFSTAEINGRQAQKYEFWLQEGANKVSETRTFFLDYQYREYVRYFLFWSCWGALDTRLTYGRGNSEFELFQQEAKRVRKAGYNVSDGDSLVFDLKLNNSFKVATGFMSKRELALNRDFYLSPFKYRYTGGNLLPIMVTSKNIAELEDGQGLFAQQYDYKYLFDDDCYTEGDVEDNGEGFDGFFFNSGGVANPTQGFQETDPTVPFWVKQITLTDIAYWNAGGNTAGSYIRNQSTHQTGAKFFVDSGRFYDKLSLPTTAPSSLEAGEAAIWIGNLSGITNDASYTLPIATDAVLGGVRVGAGLVIDANGVLSVTALGGVTSFNSRTGAISLLSADVTAALGFTPYNSSNPAGYITSAALAPYALISAVPTNNNQLSNGAGYITAAALAGYATESWVNTNYPTFSYLGSNFYNGVISDARYQYKENQRLGTNNNVAFNKVKATDTLFLPTAAPSALASGEAAMWIGSLSGITNDASYTLPIATGSVLGGIRIGSGLTIDGSGVLSVTALGGVTSFNSRTGAISLLSGDVTAALGFTPYNSSNPAGYITGAALSPYALSSSLANYQPIENQRLSTNNNVYFSSLGLGRSFRNSLTVYNSANWIGADVGGNQGSDVVVIGNLGGKATIGGHNNTLTAWADLYLNKEGGLVYINNSIAIHAGNYNSYTPTLTGVGASGTWGINITGNSNISNRLFSEIINGGNLDNITEPGQALFANVINCINAPSGSWYNIISQRHSSGGNNFVFQIAGHFFDDNVYVRNTKSESNAPWQRLLLEKEVDANPYISTANLIAKRTAEGDLATRELIITASNSHSITPDYLIGIYPATNQAVKFQASAIRTFLGSPSGGETLQSVTDRGNSTTSRIVSIASNVDAFWGNAGFETYGTNPGYGFHYPGVYGAALWMNAAGVLGYTGSGILANYLEAQNSISAGSAVGTKIGFNISDNFSAYGTTVAHYGLTFPAGGNPVALSGYFGIDFFTLGTIRVRVHGNGNTVIGSIFDFGEKFAVAGNIYSSQTIYAPVLKATDKLLIPTAPPSSLAPGEAAMWIGNLSGITS